MRIVRQKVRADGTPETEKDLLDWLKFAQSETTGIRVGFSKGEVAELDAQIEAAWRESVEAEVNRRLAERGLTVEVQKTRGITTHSTRLAHCVAFMLRCACARGLIRTFAGGGFGWTTPTANVGSPRGSCTFSAAGGSSAPSANYK